MPDAQGRETPAERAARDRAARDASNRELRDVGDRARHWAKTGRDPKRTGEKYKKRR